MIYFPKTMLKATKAVYRKVIVISSINMVSMGTGIDQILVQQVIYKML